MSSALLTSSADIVLSVLIDLMCELSSCIKVFKQNFARLLAWLSANRFERRIPKIPDLMQLPQVSSASLRQEEVIAVVLYTGPMVSSILHKTEQTTISQKNKIQKKAFWD